MKKRMISFLLAIVMVLGLIPVSAITAEATSGDYAFTAQPVNAETIVGEKTTVTWKVNFTPVRQRLLKIQVHPVDGEIVSFEELSASAQSVALDGGYAYYAVRSYYSASGYVTSEKFTVTKKVPFTADSVFSDGKTVEVDLELLAESSERWMEDYLDEAIMVEWFVGGSNVSGAADPTYTIRADDAGKRIYAVISGSTQTIQSFEKTILSGPVIYVGGVGMNDGDYLAVGAAQTTTTKPSVGYAYYNNGKLTLNNYSYEGKGYEYDDYNDYSAVIYAAKDLQITLTGTNTLTQTATNSDTIYVKNSSLTINGTGSLTNTDNGYGLYAYKDIVINGGTIHSTCVYQGISSQAGDITINGGNVTAVGRWGIYASSGAVIINGGTVTALGYMWAIYYDTSFTVADGLKIQASTTEDGELGEYVAENYDTYEKIVVTTPAVFVGGVGMESGDYLAVGATKTTTTKPSVGYAYYNNGKLILNNYSYEGKGYEYDDYNGYSAVIYAAKDLQITLTGTNTLTQTADDSDTIYVKNSSLTIDGTGSLTNTDNGYGLYADKDIVINGGTIHSTGGYQGIRSEAGDITINGGNITAVGNSGIYAVAGDFTANGGNITAISRASSSGYAINAVNIVIGTGMKIQASTTAEGELGQYVDADRYSYKKIVITGTDGWVQVDGVWYYYENGAPKVGWLEDGGRYYYFDEAGVMQTGWVKIGETWYYMEPSGARAVGWQLINGDYYYFYSSGVMKTGWLNSGGKRYFFRPDGAMATGWVQSGGNWYCMDENGAMITGWMERGGKKYYMQSNGVMVIGTVTIDGEVHQFDENGVWQGKQSQSQNGWVKKDGKWYYYKNGSKVTGWLKDGGKWYYFNASGVMQTGWVKVGNSWYYMDGSGAMHTGWLKLDGKWYYLNTSGAMVTGTVTIDGVTYKFNSSGVWIG